MTTRLDAAAVGTLTAHVRYFAAAAEAAAVPAEDVALTDGATAEDLVAALAEARGPALGRVLAISSLLVDDVVREDRDAPLTAPGAAAVRVDVLPPFAGG
ncbi:molybdopterin converting factor small subunit [Georgenia soli]|uniref:Molybdopterin converting factor small subunit n=1 Tax=Georgenia soli TaxID=638953 RepID=A0A2A9EQZ6_9MICO|nr:MoaD/ThiS family protein [Georgenia soli]PFG40670.1 molybdopterin converting factor small subunit [Georgenia soli]